MSASTILVQVEAAISALLTKGIKSYTVEDVSYTYLDLDDLRKWRDDLKAETRPAGNRYRLADIS